MGPNQCPNNYQRFHCIVLARIVVFKAQSWLESLLFKKEPCETTVFGDRGVLFCLQVKTVLDKSAFNSMMAHIVRLWLPPIQVSVSLPYMLHNVHIFVFNIFCPGTFWQVSTSITCKVHIFVFVLRHFDKYVPITWYVHIFVFYVFCPQTFDKYLLPLHATRMHIFVFNVFLSKYQLPCEVIPLSDCSTLTTS